VAGNYIFSAITTGRDHSCAITTSGAAYCWGFGGFGALGTGRSDGNSDAPSAVLGGHVFRQIGGGYDHVCALEVSERVWCWGGNAFGQLGNGTTTSSSQPVQVLNLSGIRSLAVGELSSHACALDASGQAWCWGNGQALGNGSFNHSSQPVAVQSPGPLIQIATGGGFTCGLTAAGAAWCWGSGGNGALGDGTFRNVNVPTAVSGGHVFTSIVAGGLNVCGGKADGSVWCWGYGEFGGLGSGTTSHSALPVKVSDPT
jgi:alpha-tubulin suppressor-like RCC1 family protein